MSVDLGEQIDYTTSTELVSSDLVGADRTSIVDSQATIADRDRCVLYVWYDNEAGSYQVVRCRRSPAYVPPSPEPFGVGPLSPDITGREPVQRPPHRSVNRPALCPLAASACSGQAWSLTTIPVDADHGHRHRTRPPVPGR